MRITSACLMTLGLAIACVGCSRRTNADLTDESPPHLASVVGMADGKSAFQLFSGFYYVEHGANRWTAKKFSVLLGAPPGSREKGAMLRLELTMPESIIDHLKSVTLAAAVNGT